MVVAGSEGFMKSAYRRFNIKADGKFGTTLGDDFEMMRQVINRRFERALKEDPAALRGFARAVTGAWMECCGASAL